MRANLLAAEAQSGGRVLLKLNCVLEIEGEAKPALVAELLCLLVGKREASAWGVSMPWHNEVLHPLPLTTISAEQAAENTLAANPLVGVRIEDIVELGTPADRADAGQPRSLPHSSICRFSPSSARSRPAAGAHTRCQGPALRRPGLEGELPLPQRFCSSTWPGARRSTPGGRGQDRQARCRAGAVRLVAGRGRDGAEQLAAGNPAA